jgi:hypothetical protein
MKWKKYRIRMKTDEWNERSRTLEEEKTQEEDNEWDDKYDQDKEQGKSENNFHEEDYDE